MICLNMISSRGGTMTIRHILCAVDGSEPSFRAVALGTQIAKTMGAQLTIVSIRCFHTDRTAVAGIQTPEEVDHILSQALEIAQHNRVSGARIVQLSAPDAATAIADYAEEHDAQLIFAGLSGKGALKRLALGSTSTDLLQTTDRPVTIVH
jgi:nucleotide-binding universal stress UspA family protein